MRRRPALLIFLPLLLCVACRSLPEQHRPPEGRALPPSAAGPFAALEDDMRSRFGEGTSGFRLLDRNRDALLWRLALMDSAVHTLDVQYYVWYADAAGDLFLEAVLRAADRGVAVRILVDDLLLFDGEDNLGAIESHPHVELRIFNPWRERAGGAPSRAVEFMGRMGTLNRRMHNKLVVADGHIAICGGRNIGAEYFGLNPRFNFHDLDLLAVGPVARSLVNVFDLYWNSDPIVSGAVFESEDSADRLEKLRAELRGNLRQSAVVSQVPLEATDWSERIAELLERLRPGSGRPVYDMPAVGVAEASSIEALNDVIVGAAARILVENAYWIPNAETIEFLNEAAERGVEIRVLTNSLASHDVPAVNSAWRMWRAPVLESGAEVYELRHDAQIKELQDTPPVESAFLGLHSKAFVIDDEIVYVGSHNLDPRSHDINTELGLLVESRELAAELTRLIERDMAPENSWQVHLDEDGELYWQAGERRVERQPARGGWQRFQDAFFGMLPIESQL